MPFYCPYCNEKYNDYYSAFECAFNCGLTIGLTKLQVINDFNQHNYREAV